MREQDFIIYRQEHVDWAGQGLSSTGAPGLPARVAISLALALGHHTGSRGALHLPRH